MQKLPELSIFFPFWNEEKNITPVVTKALSIAPTIARKYEVIIVDDGSDDKTLEEAEKLAKEEKAVKIVSHGVNRGYGAALRSGFEHSQYNYIVFNEERKNEMTSAW